MQHDQTRYANYVSIIIRNGKIGSFRSLVRTVGRRQYIRCVLISDTCYFASFIKKARYCVYVREREREKFIHHKANNQCDNQNEIMWLAAHANTNVYYSIYNTTKSNNQTKSI